MTTTTTATPTGPLQAITLPAQRPQPEQDRIRRPRHRKDVPDAHVMHTDSLFDRLGLDKGYYGKHRADAPAGSTIIALPVTFDMPAGDVA